MDSGSRKDDYSVFWITKARNAEFLNSWYQELKYQKTFQNMYAMAKYKSAISTYNLLS